MARSRREEYRINRLEDAFRAAEDLESPFDLYRDDVRQTVARAMARERRGAMKAYTMLVVAYARDVVFPAAVGRWAYRAFPVPDGPHQDGCRHTVQAADGRMARVYAIEEHRTRCVAMG